MQQRPVPGDGEKPRVEPEIIPPDAQRWRRTAWPDGRMWTSSDGSHRVYVARIGPFGFSMIALAVALIAAAVFLLVLGAFVILIPLAGLLLAGAVIASFLRGSLRRRW